MQCNGTHSQSEALLPQHIDNLGGKTGEGREGAKKTRYQGQAPYRIKIGQRLKYCNAHPHQIPAQQIGCQSSTRELRLRTQLQA